MENIDRLEPFYRYDVNHMRHITASLCEGDYPEYKMVIRNLYAYLRSTVNREDDFFFGAFRDNVKSILTRGMVRFGIIPADDRLVRAIDTNVQDDTKHCYQEPEYSNDYYRARITSPAKMLRLSDFVTKRLSVLDSLTDMLERSAKIDDIDRNDTKTYQKRLAQREAGMDRIDRHQMQLDMQSFYQRAPLVLHEAMDKASDLTENRFLTKDALLMNLSNHLDRIPDPDSSSDAQWIIDQMNYVEQQEAPIYDDKDGDIAARPIDNHKWKHLIGGLFQAILPAI